MEHIHSVKGSAPDGTSQVCFALCVDESRQRNCLVMAVVNEENVTARNFRAYSSSFNNEETTRLFPKTSDYSKIIVQVSSHPV